MTNMTSRHRKPAAFRLDDPQVVLAPAQAEGRAGTGAAFGLRGRKHDLRVVETERGRLAVAAGHIGHIKRSPSRNCSARSSRMCGSVTLPVPVGSSGGGRKRRKR